MAKKLHTFMGDTPAQALKKAQDTFGNEILLVENKEIRKKSLTQSGLYEIVIAVDDENAPSAPESKDTQGTQEKVAANSVQKRLDEIAEKNMAKKRQEANKPKVYDEVTLQLSDAVKQISQIANVPSNMPANPKIQPKRPYPTAKATLNKANTTHISSIEDKIENLQQTRLEQSINQKIELKHIKNELDEINDKMKIIQNMLWEEKSPKSEGINIPQEFAEIYRIAKSSGMNKEHLDTIMQLSLELMPLKMRSNSTTIKRYFREVLRKMIYCRPENLQSNAKKIIMLVGPTGVGKTTTLAKLAARYSLMLNQRYRVGVVTLDTYRLAAVDQLMAYARMMKLSIDTVVEPEEFGKAIDSLKHCDYILIDTAGHSQHDRSKLQALKSYLNNDYKIDVNLVLAINAKYEDLRDTYNAFSEMNIDTLIFSKLDESRNFGNMFSLVYETKKPISYLSIGQGVPNDLILAGNDYLVDCLLDGFKRPESK
ncbi:flagellar biosynthesis protein FlhF [Helicobacter sp. MIT 21-1697]|uniref:flagellar biosynthesis protein FlhF n=1 Tax=Helicobacter sp. MIT 21-1697 TaxID=2993733 RepID=UPI00224AFC03|nr:flagellar biosynthesis protein FlhF [Helicobacter sp. MIT 21-1697]MCX2717037.1 flagellar biosynthesis protein FlhF [Helicobacter sp. MIT 21-1697]